MSERRKIYVDVKKSKIEYYNILSAWCKNNRLFVRTNNEVFFINERVLMTPEYVINENIFIDLVEQNEITTKYLNYCQLFSKSYGTLIIIPKEILGEIHNTSKKDFENRYGVKF